jgi:hypothetical protein
LTKRKKKKSKRKPRGYWDKLENQKAFLDGLIKKYNVEPAKLTSSLIHGNGGSRLVRRYPSVRALLEAHYGPISLLDIPKVSPGTWKKKKALAQKAGIPLVMITPKDLADNPGKIWREMVSKAPWLKPKKEKALGSEYLDLF